ncbi:4Fe-4S binding protein [Clostridium botulinum]|uniref:(Fe-S)-binding protein n=1 Tax=Clostridium botulinum C/D str. DC5 TaxID=1443128 RepID=A0A0A0IFX2_CLOBO|nr:4Fe-4S binding protein [Clostridium botulinum]KGM99453.1 (Fe-S)-binding protein [Clostridium botulinum C/D str. DC5]MCD3232993.1 4Fe-4S binding protein [Clostridium botulinum D/C]MCD3239420.1 4Fe-4S binding protein [Clostridium botulinum D/C]MCD3266430.1 4Fe-4S binding protein [Clostridium botulinum D/C]MCD3298959.1 4Fe-4S binding protein [Clostridium botulinum D/C]
MKRKIVFIDKDKCNGCGICVKACHEGAIDIIEGKAKLVSDEYCDGLGDCLPACPVDAIKIIEREAEKYNEEAVKERIKKIEKQIKVNNMPCGCPGTMERKIDRKSVKVTKAKNMKKEQGTSISELLQWPIQLKLINPNSKFLEDAELLIAADCTAYAYANFHKDFIKGHITIIGCPKLDDIEYYKEKISEILTYNNIKSIKVIRMTVPCCGGIVNMVKESMLKSNIVIPYREIIIDTDGTIVSDL